MCGKIQHHKSKIILCSVYFEVWGSHLYLTLFRSCLENLVLYCAHMNRMHESLKWYILHNWFIKMIFLHPTALNKSKPLLQQDSARHHTYIIKSEKMQTIEEIIFLLLFMFYINRKFGNRENLRLPVFNGFKCFGMSWIWFHYFYKMSVYPTVCDTKIFLWYSENWWIKMHFF